MYYNINKRRKEGRERMRKKGEKEHPTNVILRDASEKNTLYDREMSTQEKKNKKKR